MSSDEPQKGRLLPFPRKFDPPTTPGLPEPAQIPKTGPVFAAFRVKDCAVMSLPLFDILLLHLTAGPPESVELHDLLRATIYDDASTKTPPAG